MPIFKICPVTILKNYRTKNAESLHKDFTANELMILLERMIV